MDKFNDIKTRLITGIIFGLISIVVGLFGAYPFMFYLAGLVIICGFEWGRLSGLSLVTSILYSLVIVSISVLVFSDGGALIADIIMIFTPIFLLLSWFYRQFYILAGLFYLTFINIFIFMGGMLHNDYWWYDIVLIWGGVILTDVGAYVVGRLIGSRKLAPTISPGKTLEGLIGAVIITAIGYGLYAVVVGKGNYVVEFVIGGSVMAVVAQMGDLYQSKMKRIAGVKDSGVILPGHGGMFDRLDGLLAVTAVTAYLYKIFNLLFEH